MKISKSKYAIVTGGARGIGKVVVKQLVQDGFTVLICARNKKEIDATCKEMNSSSEKVFGIQADVSSFSDCKKLVDYSYKKFGKINVLVNNAGIYGPIGPVEANPPKDWVNAMQINLFGTLYCSQLVIPIMKKQKSGKIINMAGAGVGGKRALARFSAYFTTKTAVVGLTEVMAAEVEGDNIQVNCISPGAINTYFTDYLLAQGKEKAGNVMYEQALNQKKNGGDSPLLAAKLIAFLASSEANHITGKMLSAKWDTIEALKKLSSHSKNLFTLRRIDNTLFYEKK